METGKILDRIGLCGSNKYEPTLETLQLLQKQYLLTVPYENLDFILNRGLSSNVLKIYKKIVENNRGGICYESNTLFLYLLQTLGFKAYMIFAKVEDLTYIGKDYPHLVLLVHLNEVDYLVDVANGQNVREPMNIENESFISISENKEYKISVIEGKYTLLVRHKQEEWLPRYYFTKEEKNVLDFPNLFENNSSSTLSNKVPLLVTIATKEGRITLQDDTITIRNAKNRRSWDVPKENKAEVLKDYFNMVIKI